MHTMQHSWLLFFPCISVSVVVELQLPFFLSHKLSLRQLLFIFCVRNVLITCLRLVYYLLCGAARIKLMLHEWEAVVLIPFIDEVGRREGEGGEAGMGGCGVDPLH